MTDERGVRLFISPLESRTNRPRSILDCQSHVGNRDAVAFLNRRADALAQRSADLKKLADAWQPLYRTLTPEQKQRMGALTIFVLRDMSDVVEQRSAQSEDED